MWDLFAIAKKAALSKKDGRDYIICAIAIRNDGVLVHAVNGYVLMNNENNRKDSYPAGHAEHRLAKKLDKGATVYVCRLSKNTNEYRMAKPCPDCERRLKASGVKKVFYTISNHEYGVLEL